MHPLSTSLDASNHEFRHDGPVARRRTSLDNSCLSADESVKLILRQTSDDAVEDREDKRPRRLSLNHNSCITVTFLATASTNRALKKADDLDMDCHDSSHDRKETTRAPVKSVISFGGVELEGSDNDDHEMECDMFEDDFDDSDCDSFCDASVQEPANKEYLVKDLGASAIWSGEASLSEWQLGTEDFNVPEAIEEGSDDENSMHALPALEPEQARPAVPQRSSSASSGSSSGRTVRRRNPLKLFRKQQRA